MNSVQLIGDTIGKRTIRQASLTRVAASVTQIGNSLNRNGSRLALDSTLLVPRHWL